MGRLYGLERSRRHSQAHWQLDFDYANKLSPDEREWLSRFAHEYYLSAPRGPENIHEPDQLRECWRAHKSNKNDCLTQSEFTGRDEADDRIGFHESDMATRIDTTRAVDIATKAWAAVPPKKTRRRKKSKAPSPIAAELGRLGGQARAKRLNKKRRKEIAELAARARWFAARPVKWDMLSGKDGAPASMGEACPMPLR